MEWPLVGRDRELETLGALLSRDGGETHLTRAYRKLDLSGRDGLAEALAGGDEQ